MWNPYGFQIDPYDPFMGTRATARSQSQQSPFTQPAATAARPPSAIATTASGQQAAPSIAPSASQSVLKAALPESPMTNQSSLPPWLQDRIQTFGGPTASPEAQERPSYGGQQTPTAPQAPTAPAPGQPLPPIYGGPPMPQSPIIRNPSPTPPNPADRQLQAFSTEREANQQPNPFLGQYETAPFPLPATGGPDPRNMNPGYHFVQGQGWVRNPGETRVPPMTPGLPTPYSWYPAGTVPGGDAATPGAAQPPATPGTPSAPGTTTAGGYTFPSQWGRYRGNMIGFNTRGYDERNVWDPNSGEFGVQVVAARILSQIDPTAPDAIQQAEKAFTAAGIRYQRDGVDRFFFPDDPQVGWVDILRNKQSYLDRGNKPVWNWLTHPGTGPGQSGAPGEGGAPGGGTPGGGTPGAYPPGWGGPGTTDFLDPNSPYNRALLEWILRNGALVNAAAPQPPR